MKCKGIIFFLLVASSVAWAQDMKAFKLYRPEEDAAGTLKKVIRQAKLTGRHVFIQIGGNWCIWCARFNEFVTKDAQVDSLINADYLVYHLNYSKENFNRALLMRFGFPQRFGFPVFIVLDGNGNQLHIQDSGYLEEGKGSTGYNKQKVMEFFRNWAPKALDATQYKNF